MNEKWTKLLPVLLIMVFAVTRWPGLMPLNFSAAYALAFCAGVFFPRPMAWWLPLGAIAGSDLALNLYYHHALGIDAFKATQLFNYAAFAALIWLGTRFRRQSSLLRLVSGGILGACVFYLLTNTAAWLFNPFNNPEYTRTVTGWFIALTKGTAGYPQTWEFFRNTLLSGGLFTFLFAGAMKFGEAAEETASEGVEGDVPEAQAEESKA